MATNQDRVNFGSKIGAILAAAGSAVGLGNIWRFPYETGNHGGAAFILIYLLCIVVLGLPIMIAEFSIGRHSRARAGRQDAHQLRHTKEYALQRGCREDCGRRDAGEPGSEAGIPLRRRAVPHRRFSGGNRVLRALLAGSRLCRKG